MRLATIMFALVLCGCHNQTIRVASPQIQHAPDLCIVVLQSNSSTDIAKAALDACTRAIDRRQGKP
jgi:hypothetical protein